VRAGQVETFIEQRCPKCGRRLLDAAASGVVRLNCRRCGELVEIELREAEAPVSR
jgi:phage FluMu protein Com